MKNATTIDWGLWLMTVAIVPLSFIGGRYWPEQLLQHLPTSVGLAVLGWLLATGRLSGLSIRCLLLFAWLHVIGARWLYSMVPYDAWFVSWTGVSLSDRFGWQRNHYDRLVHLASGILFLPPSMSWLRQYNLPSKAVMGLAIAIVMMIAAIYEIAEWGIAVTMSPKAAEAYNGQQGDIWDPQKDMALALIGSLAVVMAKALRSVTMHRPLD